MSDDAISTCSCSKCLVNIEYPVEMAGDTVDCPQCSSPLILPKIVPEYDNAPLTVNSVLSEFSGGIDKRRTSFLYRAGLLLVAVMMVLLPIVYIALICSVAWGVYYYATHFIWLLGSTHGGARVYALRLTAYLGPLAIGAILVFFMIKPLLARRSVRPAPITLIPSKEPILFAYIYRICELIGAPSPSRIDVDCDLNASASLENGFVGIFRRELVLTLGLPLAAGLDARQFAGVVAHEFGHFTQGAGMGLSYVIRRINGWFARVIYERDGWDLSLQEWGEGEEDFRMKIVIAGAKGAIWTSRTLLKPLMYLGHGISCFLVRQMEYDADNYQTKLAGSQAFESTVFRVRVLAGAMKKTYSEMRRLWMTNRGMPDDLAGYIIMQETLMLSPAREQIINVTGLATTGVFDTHPSDADRIRQARKAGESGVFHLDRPAAELFTDFKSLSRRATLEHYANNLGISMDTKRLKPVDAFKPS